MTPEQEAEIKAKYRRFVKITIGEKVLAFKPLDKAKVGELKKQLDSKPELAIDLCINACKFVCVHGKEFFDELATEYPLAFSGGGKDAPGVIDALYEMAHGQVSIEVK